MKKLLTGAAMAAILAAGIVTGGTPAKGDLESQLVMTTYGVGTGTYNDLAAVADSLTRVQGTQVRILPSDTMIGRAAPLRADSAQFSRMGDEYYFAFEGIQDFASENWGPQDLRIAWAPMGNYGMLARTDAGLDSFEDLKGKKFPRIIANNSINIKLEAYLAYGGLTWEDVKPVDMSYSDQTEALETGRIDVLFSSAYGSNLEELASKVDVDWMSMDKKSPERMKRVHELAPMVTVGEFSGAPGMEEGESAKNFAYTVPISTYADTDSQTVYELVKAIDENYDRYKNTTPSVSEFALDEVLHKPQVVPFHKGTVRYLKEKGLWTDEAERKNNRLIERQSQLQAGWDEFIKTADKDNLAQEWIAWKEENLD
ncbi:TAXI family TRAP transporter solute-binding subunit [Arthrobacter sp. H14]|uniref:TAXI family TRAP transporter solute-binding subunit n=1 Tax=Arthrobacter sp. H14 TaxID=1312959 RepID=UPI0004B6B034|nr:TAXI family TRAP transporter solute-binding subunit [Arthrobacter sp. H14]